MRKNESSCAGAAGGNFPPQLGVGEGQLPQRAKMRILHSARGYPAAPAPGRRLRDRRCGRGQPGPIEKHVDLTKLGMLKELLAYAQDPDNGVWLAPVAEVASFIAREQATRE